VILTLDMTLIPNVILFRGDAIQILDLKTKLMVRF